MKYSEHERIYDNLFESEEIISLQNTLKQNQNLTRAEKAFLLVEVALKLKQKYPRTIQRIFIDKTNELLIALMDKKLKQIIIIHIEDNAKVSLCGYSTTEPMTEETYQDFIELKAKIDERYIK